jgi:prepilin-type N-terminal cleavage/methylation domain-containing protein
MRPRRRPRQTGGFTLVELMVAVFLLAVGVLAISQVFAVSNRHTSNARLETEANSLVQEIREKVLSETFDDIESIFDGIDTDNPGGIPTPAQDWADHVIARLGPGARGRVDITPSAEAPELPDGMVRVEILLNWYQGSELIELPMEFLVAKIGA